MTKVTITLGDPEQSIPELVRIVYFLRKRTKIWQQYYGAQNRKQMKTFEDAVDKWLEEHVKIEEPQYAEKSHEQLR